MTLITSVDGYACLQGDCIEIPLEDRVADLCFTSPPYEDARTYAELAFKLKGILWVEWAVPRFLECLRVTKGMVCWVVQARTRAFHSSIRACLPPTAASAVSSSRSVRSIKSKKSLNC